MVIVSDERPCVCVYACVVDKGGERRGGMRVFGGKEVREG